MYINTFKIMDYEKKYKESLEKAQRFYNNSVAITKKGLEDIFPEHAESEDERIRKNIIATIHLYYGEPLDDEAKEMIAWLEKQGEHAKFRDSIQVGDKVTRNKDGVLVNLSQLKRIAKPAEEYNITGIGSKNAQGKLGEMIKNLKPVNEVLEQKPDWNEKYIADVFEKVGLAKIAREQSNDTLTNALQDAMIELSKFTPQPKQEWSEEDKEMSRFIGNAITTNGASIYLKSKGIQVIDAHVWLNGLKERVQPQSTWKPSDEQMNALNYVVNLMASSERPTENDLYYNILKSLIEQLKKLREE